MPFLSIFSSSTINILYIALNSHLKFSVIITYNTN
jgi:hypothetical protein